MTSLSISERLDRQKKWSKAIISLAPELRTKLHPYVEDIVVRLRAERGLSEIEAITITSQGNPIYKVDRLLDYIKTKDHWVPELFCSVLDEIGQVLYSDALRRRAGFPAEVGAVVLALPTPKGAVAAEQQEEEEPVDIIDQKPKGRDVLNVVVPRLKATWETLAIQLEVADHEIDAIRMDHEMVRDRCYQVLKNWLNGGGRKPVTWNTLLKAIRLEGFEDFATDLEQKIKQNRELY